MSSSRYNRKVLVWNLSTFKLHPKLSTCHLRVSQISQCPFLPWQDVELSCPVFSWRVHNAHQPSCVVPFIFKVHIFQTIVSWDVFVVHQHWYWQTNIFTTGPEKLGKKMKACNGFRLLSSYPLSAIHWQRVPLKVQLTLMAILCTQCCNPVLVGFRGNVDSKYQPSFFLPQTYFL